MPRFVEGDFVLTAQMLSRASKLAVQWKGPKSIVKALKDLIAHAMRAEGGHLVSKLLKCRIGPATHAWEIQVEWVGLDPLEASWEPATVIYEDVPALVQRFVERTDSAATRAMWASLTKTSTARKQYKSQRRRKGRQ
ncbi:Hypothetical protein PHPALM_205 [Phytophthora palmivora]|uniref:Chromo domain-containing protein n=1 Tax=Phytophthora palmivora TaxID=4796 RepID=A0A2P4YVF7_9STRA|nr:Hypothetical protein PHPALM_205 [Phytophthora palmivora]